MNGYELVEMDGDLFVEDEDFDEYFMEDIDDSLEEDDDFGERRRRRRRRPPRIRAGRTARGRGFYKRPTSSRTPVSTSTLQASLDRVGRDIRTNAAAIKRLEAQAKTATAKLNSVNNSQDKNIADLQKKLKTQGSASQMQNQLYMMLPLLQKQAELEAKPNLQGDASIMAKNVLGTVQIKKQDTTLPLLMMMMASSQTGGNGASNTNMLLPLVLLLDK